MKKQSNGTKAPGVEVPRETVDLSKVDVAQIRKWLEADVQRCISLLIGVSNNKHVLDELAEAFYSNMKVLEAEKEAAGQL